VSDYQAGQEPKQRVVITKLDGKGNPKTGALDVVEAQFNPTSLQYSINNTLEQGSGKQKSRKVGDSTGKLSMELVYDTTDTGTDVRITTQTVAMLMRPEGKGQLTPVVRVTWGIFKFEGVLDSYRETLDFFSTDGVPLRASLSLSFSTVSKHNATPSKVFAFGSAAPKDKDQDDDKKDGKSKDSKTVETSPEKATPAEIGKMFGDPVLARQIAKKNGVEDIRNGSDAGEEPYEVVDEPQLDGPLGFAPSGGGGGLGADLGAGAGASAGASFGAAFGASAGLSAGVSGGFGASAGASFGANASAGFGASAGGSFSANAGGSFSAGASGSFSANAGGSFSAGASGSFSADANGSFSAGASASFSASASASVSADGSYSASASYSAEASYSYRAGGQASAGVSAVDGAFAALRPRPSQSTQRIDLDLLLPGTPSRVLTVDAPEAFGPGGIVVRSGSSSFDVDVGASFSLSERITFED